MVRADGRTTTSSTAPPPILQGLELNGDNHLVGIHSSEDSAGPTGRTIAQADAFRIATSNPTSGLLAPEAKTSELEEFKFRINEAYEPIYLNGCDDYVVMSIFNHASHTLMTVDDSSGQALMVGGEQLQQGYAFKNGSKTFDIISSTATSTTSRP